MVKKWQLPCCALCQLTCNDSTPIEELKESIEKLKKDARKWWHSGNRDSGERACFVITTPDELILESKLDDLGFKPVAEFSRRKGYPQNGLLTMWFLNW